jgi:hypothetical protein
MCSSAPVYRQAAGTAIEAAASHVRPTGPLTLRLARQAPALLNMQRARWRRNPSTRWATCAIAYRAGDLRVGNWRERVISASRMTAKSNALSNLGGVGEGKPKDQSPAAGLCLSLGDASASPSRSLVWRVADWRRHVRVSVRTDLCSGLGAHAPAWLARRAAGRAIEGKIF